MRFISLDKAHVRVKARRIDVRQDHPVGWYFSEWPNGYVMPPEAILCELGSLLVEGGMETCLLHRLPLQLPIIRLPRTMWPHLPLAATDAIPLAILPAPPVPVIPAFAAGPVANVPAPGPLG